MIDRAGDRENVYFLTLVDEADLLALIEEKEPALGGGATDAGREGELIFRFVYQTTTKKYG